MSVYSIIGQLLNGELINEGQVYDLCFQARDILLNEGNIQHVVAPVTVQRPSTHLLIGLIPYRYVGISTGSFTT